MKLWKAMTNEHESSKALVSIYTLLPPPSIACAPLQHLGRAEDDLEFASLSVILRQYPRPDPTAFAFLVMQVVAILKLGP